jgi:lipopolysaccharide/colanic/teichoic acid biosynthesis glycosyltransferase/glycosyltransferase involved in cell wall biosynthesis
MTLAEAASSRTTTPTAATRRPPTPDREHRGEPAIIGRVPFQRRLPDRPQRLRVLHLVTTGADLGGAQRNTLATIEGLLGPGYHFEVAHGPGRAVAEAARALGVGTHVIPHLGNGSNPWHDFRALLEIIALLRRGRYHIVHTHCTKAGLLGRLASWLCRVPVIVHTIHGTPFVRGERPLVRWLTRYGEWLAARMSHLLIAVGANVKQEFAEAGICAPEKIAVVHSGIDYAPLDGPVDRQRARAALGLAPEDRAVVAVGHLMPCKGYGDLIEAARQVCLRSPQARFLIVGDGPLRARLAEQILAAGVNGRIRLLGERDDVPALLAASDVYVRSSLWEGVGRAVVEAMYARKPVVVTELPGILEVVRDGETGLLAPPGDPAALAAAIERVLDDPQLADRLARQGRERVAPLFCSRLMVARIHEIYQRAIGQVAGARAPGWLTRRGYAAVKRAADIAVSLCGLLVSAPLWLLIAMAIYIDDGLPVFFVKHCVTLGGRPFGQLKFRTMRVADPSVPHQSAERNDPRITRVGRMLRKSALDELPQLVNIVKGEMSFVGPRPQARRVVAEHLRAIPNYGARHSVRPGLTGLAQVRGSYFTTPHDKLRYDLLYARRCNPMLDAWLFATSFAVSFRGGWSNDGKR